MPKFDNKTIEALKDLHVIIIETHAIFDSWLERSVDNSFYFRDLQPNKFRKMDVFLNPIFRNYDRLIFLDADGIIGNSLEPLVKVRMPSDVTILLRQNDQSFGKNKLWENEYNTLSLTFSQGWRFGQAFPDRTKSGATCFFIVNVKKLPSPGQLMLQSLDILCNYRAAFKYNDQSIINLLFYHNISLIPWCVWDEVIHLESSPDLLAFCKEGMQNQRRLNGRLTFIYRHMNKQRKASCLGASQALSENAGQLPFPSKDANNGTTAQTAMPLYVNDIDSNASCLQALHEWKQRLPQD